jgi:transcription elongation factor GreB
MSKAFTKEPDEDEDFEGEIPALAAGTKNYITPTGLERLREEFAQLQKIERPKTVETVSWAAGNGDRSENGDYIYGKQRLREIDRRLRFLRKRMEIAEVVDPARQKDHSRIYFGATVVYRDSHNSQKTVRIVGVDEARPDHNEVSIVSPVARALLKAEVGDVVEIRTPNGAEPVEVLEVRY